jgi:hypothetical protein
MKQASIEVRNSPVHGSGVFALRRIRKGTTIIEYLGDRVSHEEVDERYADKLETDSHTFLFTVNSKIVIDAGSNGNDARFINHSCDPNCESTIKNKRVFIEAIRTIQPGEELNDEIFACRCGASNCRGSMLEPLKKPRVRRKQRARKTAAGSRRKPSARGKRTGRGKTAARSRALAPRKSGARRRAGATAGSRRPRASKLPARRGR